MNHDRNRRHSPEKYCIRIRPTVQHRCVFCVPQPNLIDTTRHPAQLGVEVWCGDLKLYHMASTTTRHYSTLNYTTYTKHHRRQQRFVTFGAYRHMHGFCYSCAFLACYNLKRNMHTSDSSDPYLFMICVFRADRSMVYVICMAYRSCCRVRTDLNDLNDLL